MNGIAATARFAAHGRRSSSRSQASRAAALLVLRARVGAALTPLHLLRKRRRRFRHRGAGRASRQRSASSCAARCAGYTKVHRRRRRDTVSAAGHRRSRAAWISIMAAMDREYRRPELCDLDRPRRRSRSASLTPSSLQLPSPDSCFQILVQAVSVRVHRDDGGEIAHPQVPHGFGRAELGERHAVRALDAACVVLRGSADGVQVNSPGLLEALAASRRPCRPSRQRRARRSGEESRPDTAPHGCSSSAPPRSPSSHHLPFSRPDRSDTEPRR